MLPDVRLTSADVRADVTTKNDTVSSRDLDWSPPWIFESCLSHVTESIEHPNSILDIHISGSRYNERLKTKAGESISLTYLEVVYFQQNKKRRRSRKGKVSH